MRSPEEIRILGDASLIATIQIKLEQLAQRREPDVRLSTIIENLNSLGKDLVNEAEALRLARIGTIE